MVDRLRTFFSRGERRFDPVTRYLALTLAGAALIAMLAYWFYNRTHLFTEYKVQRSAELDDVEGTQYELLSGRLIKYGHDGVFCTNLKNETLWSAAYTMQTPISDVCGSSMVIAEQQGSQVYVINARGVIGSFNAPFPVMKARVASNGVVALVLNDDNNTAWVNLYSPDGAQIASVKATQSDSGYPLDIALSANARELLVSFLTTEGGELTGRVALYDFSSADAADESHLLAMESFKGTVFPEVFFAATGPVAVADDGFVAFSSGSGMKQTARLELTDEIVSVFHDSRNIGFVFRSGRSDVKYHMTVYGYNAKSTMETDVDFAYTDVRMADSEILLYDAASLFVYRTSGRQKLAISYAKPVAYFAGREGSLRSYLVITGAGIEQIRVY